ncbi:hypothetical protein X772_25090 [Mesorhizobium sp. LSJC280B00]|nr:hypothetical protein X772_25090 [Mesorhizobium sp. LSJC280B00]
MIDDMMDLRALMEETSDSDLLRQTRIVAESYEAGGRRLR